MEPDDYGTGRTYWAKDKNGNIVKKDNPYYKPGQTGFSRGLDTFSTGVAAAQGLTSLAQNLDGLFNGTEARIANNQIMDMRNNAIANKAKLMSDLDGLNASKKYQGIRRLANSGLTYSGDRSQLAAKQASAQSYANSGISQYAQGTPEYDLAREQQIYAQRDAENYANIAARTGVGGDLYEHSAKEYGIDKINTDGYKDVDSWFS